MDTSITIAKLEEFVRIFFNAKRDEKRYQAVYSRMSPSELLQLMFILMRE
jgi:hypothetical protein